MYPLSAGTMPPERLRPFVSAYSGNTAGRTIQGPSPILRALPKGAAVDSPSPETDTHSRKSTQRKRNRITVVACTPCQIRKCKCDGARPICTACQNKGRSDCVYDSISDQRRTTSLKLRIASLEKEAGELRDLIWGIGDLSTREASIAVAEQLCLNEFHTSTHAADMRRPSVMIESSESPVETQSQDTFMYDTSPGSTGESGQVISQEIPGILHTQQRPSRTSEASTYESLTVSPMMTVENPYNYPPASRAYDSPASNFAKNLPSPHTASRRESQDHKVWQKMPPKDGLVLCRLSVAAPSNDGSTFLASKIMVPQYAVQPFAIENACPMSRMYCSFLEEKRQLLLQGWPLDDALGTVEENLYSLTFPDSACVSTNPRRTICQWAANIFGVIDGLQLAEKVAISLMIVRFIRWRVVPTEEAFSRVPDCMKPTHSQILTRHPAWIDLIPWPSVRDDFIENHQTHNPISPLISLCAAMSVNWKSSPTEILYRVDSTNTFHVYPAFEQYCCDINNWSIDPSALSMFPRLSGKVSVKRRELP